MSEPTDIVNSLGQFTPDAGNVNRDAIVFAAGRASAGWPFWRDVAIGLLVTQCLSASLWMYGNRSADENQSVPIPEIEPTPKAIEPSPVNPESWVWAVHSLRSDDDLRTQGNFSVNAVPTELPLTPRSHERFDN